MTILGVSALAVILIISITIFLQPRATSSTTTDVVLLICYPQYNNNPPNPPLIVGATSSSEGAPVITAGSDCAQSLSDVMSDGFVIEDVQPQGLNEGGGYYTLVRNPTTS